MCDLRSLDDPNLSFVVVPPGPFFADYSPSIDASVTAELGLEDENDLLALVVVTLGDTPESADRQPAGAGAGQPPHPARWPVRPLRRRSAHESAPVGRILTPTRIG